MASRPVVCDWCGKTFDKEIKRINETKRLGKKHACSRKCASDMVNQDRKCDPITKNAINTRKDKHKFPEKNKARELVRKAVDAGHIVPSDECEMCFKFCSTEGHHPDHSRPYLLVYLCKECHRKADASEDKWEYLATDYSEQVERK